MSPAATQGSVLNSYNTAKCPIPVILTWIGTE